MFRGRLPLLGLILLLAGCSKSLVLKVNYPALDRLAAQYEQSYSKPYIVLRIPGSSGDIIRPPRLDAVALGEALVAAYAGRGISTAFQIVDSETEIPFAAMLGASGILEVSLAPVSLGSQKSKETWKASASVNGYTRLLSSRGTAISSKSTFAISLEEEIKEKNEEENWFKQKKGTLLEKSVKEIMKTPSAEKNFKERMVNRSVMPGKKDTPMYTAFDKARGGDWNGAVLIWQDLAQRERSAIAWHNLAVNDERQNLYEDALLKYRKALDVYSGTRAKLEGYWYVFPGAWTNAIEDMERLVENQKLSSSSAPVASPWFERKIAVLPFSNGSNFVDAPELVRFLIHQRLRHQGYNVMDSNIVDETLRNMGVTDGGQLTAYFNDQIAKALKTDMLLYGDITAFNQIPLGIYHKREVGCSLKLIPTGSAKPIWEMKQRVLYQDGGGKDAGLKLFAQLAKGIYDRLRKAPMKEEASDLAKAILSHLPSKAAGK